MDITQIAKTILITGASSGFGKATAQLLAKQGHRLILVARRKDLLEKLLKELNTDVYIASVNVRNKTQVEEFFNTIPNGYKGTSLLHTICIGEYEDKKYWSHN